MLIEMLIVAFFIQNAAAWYKPTVDTTWQIQYGGTYLDQSFPATVYNIDGFNATSSLISQLHSNGHKVICYFSAGSYENYTPDKSSFPAAVLGKVLDGWPDEKWLDVRALSTLQPIMTARAQLAANKGCDGIDWDNVDGYNNDSGFTLSYDDQIAYNTMLSSITHNLNMAVGLKNDLDQVEDLISYFDFAVNESCQQYNECDTLFPFIQAGKPVWAISYAGLTKTSTCAAPNSWGFQMLLKNLALDAPVYSCSQQLSLGGSTASTTSSKKPATSTTSSKSTTSATSSSTTSSKATTTSSSTTSKAAKTFSTSTTIASCATIAGAIVCSSSSSIKPTSSSKSSTTSVKKTSTATTTTLKKTTSTSSSTVKTTSTTSSVKKTTSSSSKPTTTSMQAPKRSGFPAPQQPKTTSTTSSSTTTKRLEAVKTTSSTSTSKLSATTTAARRARFP